MNHAIFDTEIIGTKKPVFLVCVRIVETGKEYSFWGHKPKDVDKLEALIHDKDLTWVGFNSENFDRPLIAACLMGYDPADIKILATNIIENQMKSWQTYREFKLDFVEYDHIDLFDVAPGPMISLKTYAGRMGFPTMVDLPFHHDKDLTPKECKILNTYCLNDLGVTEALWRELQEQNELRVSLSKEYGLDLRSKSDAQIAEAVFKSRVGIKSGTRGVIPSYVEYKAPKIIFSPNQDINQTIDALESIRFTLNRGNGAIITPSFLEKPIKIKDGSYQMGIGGLHSVHDVNFYIEASDDLIIEDIDVASYYPSIMIKAGLTPKLEWGKGDLWVKEYEAIYHRRLREKAAKHKVIANSLKIMLNGTFGKLGSVFCCFYAPELLLAVTLTGQLNLLCLIAALERKGIRVLSANTDGIMIAYHPSKKDIVTKEIERNTKRTGFIYECVNYRKVAIKDVNNYIAVKTELDEKGLPQTKRKGLYAISGVAEMKNPTMEVCSNMVCDYLVEGVLPEISIKRYKDIKDFVAIRNVKGGGVQHKEYRIVDDWEHVDHKLWFSPTNGKTAKRVSRPDPYQYGTGGVPFGRVARWYMTTKNIPPITYVESHNKVPKTEGAMLCMTLPDKLPADLSYQWYINEAYAILGDLGVKIR